VSNSLPVITVSPLSPSLCAGNSLLITASGASTYTWNGSSASNSLLVSPGANTVYAVSALASNGCSNSRTVGVTVVQRPIVAVNSGTICAGNTFTLVPSGAVSYTFTSGSNTVNPVSTTSYSVSGSNSLGCVSAAPAVANVTVFALPVVSVNSGSICNGGIFVFQPSGALTYSFSGSNPVTPSVTTSYTVTGNNAAGCISQPAIGTVTVVALPSIVIANAVQTLCAGQTTSFSATGAVTYTWSTGSSSSVLSLTPTANAGYYVNGTSPEGCVASANVSVTVYSLPVITINADKPFICSPEPVLLTASGATSYSWTNPSVPGASVSVTPSVSTVYSVSGLSSSGCTGTKTISVQVSTVVLSVSGNSAVCAGEVATLTAAGASTYTWSLNNSPFATLVYTPTATQTYTVYGKGQGCLFSKTITVVALNKPVVNATLTRTLICLGETTTISAQGADTYSWNQGATGSVIVVTPTVATKYSYVATAMAVNGCTAISNSVLLTVDKCVGLTAVTRFAELKLYPNPNSGEFMVEGLPEGVHALILTDVTGRVVSTFTVSEASRYDIRELSQGIYYIIVPELPGSQPLKVIKN
jgi:hypothetical protein